MTTTRSYALRLKFIVLRQAAGRPARKSAGDWTPASAPGWTPVRCYRVRPAARPRLDPVVPAPVPMGRRLPRVPRFPLAPDAFHPGRPRAHNTGFRWLAHESAHPSARAIET